MSAIVPFVANELAKPENAAMAIDIFGEGVKAARNLYKAKAGRTPKWKRAAREKKGSADLGHAPSRQEPRKNSRQSAVTGIDNKTFFNVPVINIEKDVASNDAINKRNRDLVVHKGSKICFDIKNRLKVPIYFNWAVVIPKAATTVSNSNILRGARGERDLLLDNSRTYMDLKCNPINTDLYKVVRHRKMTILPDSDKGTNINEGRDYVFMEEYIKTNRKLYFDGDTATPLQNMFMVWWCDYYNSPTGATSLTADVNWKIVDYFHDVP